MPASLVGHASWESASALLAIVTRGPTGRFPGPAQRRGRLARAQDDAGDELAVDDDGLARWKAKFVARLLHGAGSDASLAIDDQVAADRSEQHGLRVPQSDLAGPLAVGH